MKAIARNDIPNKLEIVLISNYVNEITGDEKRINPLNASLFGLGRVVNHENPELTCRCIDIDDLTKVTDIFAELKSGSSEYQVAYRNGQRFVEKIVELDLTKVANRDIPMREQGVYIITGGTGGIGLEVARFFSTKGQVNLALIGRSDTPGRDQWDEVLSQNNNSKLILIIKIIREIETTGSKVDLYGIDISNMTQVKVILSELRLKYGRINGIAHCAGMIHDELIVRQDYSILKEVLAPKVYGTWVLDTLIREDPLDFLVLFSSVSTAFSAPGMGSYVAANSFLDSFAAYCQKRGQITISINWASWEKTGIANRYNINIETLYKNLSVAQALEALNNILQKKITRVMVGEFNYNSKMILTLENSYYQLSDNIKKLLQKQPKLTSSIKSKRLNQTGEITLKGRDGRNYTEIEHILAELYRNMMGFTEINIYDNFFELGGDSILLTRMYKELDKLFPNRLKITDLFAYTSIDKLAKYLSVQVDSHLPEQVKLSKENNDQELLKIINEMEKGNLTVDQVVESLKEIEL